MTSVQDTLRRFGITRCYKGFNYTAYCIALAVDDDFCVAYNKNT